MAVVWGTRRGTCLLEPNCYNESIIMYTMVTIHLLTIMQNKRMARTVFTPPTQACVPKVSSGWARLYKNDRPYCTSRENVPWDRSCY